MKKYIELDHTSSGVQIAAALTCNLPTALATNIAGTHGKKPTDLYTLVVNDANAALDELGFFADGKQEKLERADVKRAVIAMVYGGGLQGNADEAFYTKYGQEITEVEHLEALRQAITHHMEAVMNVQRYMYHIVRAVADAGYNSVRIPIGNGSTFSEVIGEFKREQDFKLAFNHNCEEKRAHLRGVLVPHDSNDKGKAARSLTAAFIQSIDAALLAATQKRLSSLSVPYYSKHDAYLIEECHRAVLTKATQESFFEVMSEGWLDKLRDFITAHYPEADVYSFDKYGDYDLNLVFQSEHMISE